jgi:cobalt-zinc-cadmium efflux system protein
VSTAASHAGHSHGVSPTADRRRLWLALFVIVGYMLAEVVVGLLAHSLALLSDAGHMLTDAASIGLSLVASGWPSGRPAAASPMASSAPRSSLP